MHEVLICKFMHPESISTQNGDFDTHMDLF